MTVNRKTKILFPLIAALGCLIVAASFNMRAVPTAATTNLSGFLNLGAQKAFGNLDPTPSVAGANWFYEGNSEFTTITDFDDGTDGQIIVIRCGTSSTTIAAGESLILGGGQSFMCTRDDVLMLIQVPAGKWLEISRSHNTRER